MLMILLKILNEKMKKVLFILFLLFLSLGTVSVNAQVRIGGNTAPNASAVLDLNANDTNNGTKGLALPRVGLTSNTMLLPGVTANLTGMLVYNTTTTGGAGVNTIGIYFWNGATWVKANLPSTSAADSGKILMSNGSSIVLASKALTSVGVIDSLTLKQTFLPLTWSLILDTVIYPYVTGGRNSQIVVPGLRNADLCVSGQSWGEVVIFATTNYLTMHSTTYTNFIGNPLRLRCFRPSI